MKHDDLEIQILVVGLSQILRTQFSTVLSHSRLKLHFSQSYHFSNHKGFPVILITSSLPKWETLAQEIKIEYPHIILVILFDDCANISSDTSDCIGLYYVLWNSSPLIICQLFIWIEALFLEKMQLSGTSVQIGDGMFSLVEGIYTKDGSSVILSEKQSLLLRILLKNRGNVVSRSLILKEIWEKDKKVVTDRVIDTNIVALRKILGDAHRDLKCLETVFGQGYRLTFH